MRRTLKILSFTLVLIAALDTTVAFTLNWAERNWRLGGLVQYFEYGRSVPGKLAKWRENPDAGFNLLDVGWRNEGLALSASEFAAEPIGNGPVIRSYGMSFVNNIIEQAVGLQPDLEWDEHAGPGVPPNYTYAYFEDDRESRREGDIAVLGILSSTLPVMQSFSNQTWAFEQPAPLTYPIYQPEGDGLARIDPLVQSVAQLTSLKLNDNAADDWHAQLRRHDAFYGAQTHGASFLDTSPFIRLIRRAAATSHITKTKTAILASQSYPYKAVLQRMIIEFARTSRADGQIPIVMLIQSKEPNDAGVLAIAKPVMEQENIKYFATSEHFDPRDLSGFQSDGHYRAEIDRHFGAEFLKLLSE